MEKNGQKTEAEVPINHGDSMPFKIDKIADTGLERENGVDFPVYDIDSPAVQQSEPANKKERK